MPAVQASNGCKLFSRSHALLASTLRSSSMAGWPIVLSKHMQTLAMASIKRIQAWYESERKNARAVLSLLSCHRFFCRFVEGALAASKISKRLWFLEPSHEASCIFLGLGCCHSTILGLSRHQFEDLLCPFGDDQRLGPPATKAGTSNLRLNLWKIGGCHISKSPESQERRWRSPLAAWTAKKRKHTPHHFEHADPC